MTTQITLPVHVHLEGPAPNDEELGHLIVALEQLIVESQNYVDPQGTLNRYRVISAEVKDWDDVLELHAVPDEREE